MTTSHANVHLFELDEKYEREVHHEIQKAKHHRPKCVDPLWVVRYDREASKSWNKFYRQNQDSFFKDRHYLFKEFVFPENVLNVTRNVLTDDTRRDELGAISDKFVICDLGCGVGNTAFPLLDDYEIFRADLKSKSVHQSRQMHFVGVDTSEVAVKLFNDRGQEEKYRDSFFASCGDLCSESLIADSPLLSAYVDRCDCALLIFVLSAVSSQSWSTVLMTAHSLLKPGGVVVFRDYCFGDMAQLRFERRNIENPETRTNRLGDNSYIRGDGTRATFFTTDELERIFVAAGFKKRKVWIDSKTFANRARELEMKRLWLNAIFEKV